MLHRNLWVIALLASATTTLARPAGFLSNLLGACMSDKEAQQVATNFGTLISNYSDALADKALTADFKDYSESVKLLVDTCNAGPDDSPAPLSPVFTNRTQFEVGQGSQPKNNYQQLNIWHTCKTVNFRWVTTDPPGVENPDPVVGIITAVAQRQNSRDFPWVINTVYTEFDSGTWLQNLQGAGLCLGG